MTVRLWLAESFINGLVKFVGLILFVSVISTTEETITLLKILDMVSRLVVGLMLLGFPRINLREKE